MLIQGLLMTSGETERFRNQFDRLSQDEEEPEPLSSSPLAADAEDQFSCSPEIPDINSWKRPDLQQLCKRKKIKFNARDTRKHRLVEFYLNAKREELKQSQKRKTSNKGSHFSFSLG